MKHAITILGIVVVLSGGLLAQSPERIHDLSVAIADVEGFGVKGAIPTRYHNPGDLKSNPCPLLGWTCKVKGKGKGGHIIFASNQDGWKALEAQIILMTNGQSRFYHRNMTFRQMSRQYAGNWKRWLRNICHDLKVRHNTELWDFFEMPPDIQFRQTKLVLVDCTSVPRLQTQGAD